MFNQPSFLVLVVSTMLPSLLCAQTTEKSPSHDEIEEVRVLAHPLADNETAQAVTVLQGDELARQVQTSLGETLSKQAGIQSASFASAVGRPIIHGLAGARVKTTEDRIDTLDVSVTSGDHAVGVEPFIATQIAVLRGSSTLLYGSGAIGGVVDVSTNRINAKMPEQTSGRLQLRATDNADARNGAFTIDAPLSTSLVLHADAFYGEADDYEIPGFAESAFQIAAEDAEVEAEVEVDADEHEEEEESFGILEGSRMQRGGGAIGLSLIGERGFAGISISSLDSEYGLVGGHGHEEDDEHGHEEGGAEVHGEAEGEGPGMIDMSQTRFDIEAQLEQPFAGIENLNFRLGVNDYEHEEIEPNGEVGTRFENDAWEGRIELKHLAWNGFAGVVGVQLSEREFSAIGEEAFVPAVKSESLGVFWVGQRSFGQTELEAGARWETVEHSPTAARMEEVDFDTASVSLGIVHSLNDNFSLSALVDLASRAPTIEELFSDGPHLATQSFEIGEPNLDEEQVTAVTLSSSYGNETFELDAGLYLMDFSHYIYQANSGGIKDGLPVFNYQQQDATFRGIDVKGLVHLGVVAKGDLDITFLFDLVRGELDNSRENLPRIPASRFGLGLAWENHDWNARLNYLHVDDQRRLAAFELATDGYDDLSLMIERTWTVASNDIRLFLHGRNLTDDEQRHHGSIVKDFAPAAGRRFEIGVRFDF